LLWREGGEDFWSKSCWFNVVIGVVNSLELNVRFKPVNKNQTNKKAKTNKHYSARESCSSPCTYKSSPQLKSQSPPQSPPLTFNHHLWQRIHFNHVRGGVTTPRSTAVPATVASLPCTGFGQLVVPLVGGGPSVRLFQQRGTQPGKFHQI
jgi:hypothetical protein